MFDNRKLFATVACLLLLPGCTQWKATARINPSTVAVYPGAIGKEALRRNRGAVHTCQLTGGFSDSKRGAINLDCFKFPEDKDSNVTAYQRATIEHQHRTNSARETSLTSKDAVRQAAAQSMHARNRLSAILVKHADDVCVLEKGRIVATESTVNFILSFLTQGFSGASTIVQGELAKTILSGVATLASGTQSNVNATFYRNQIIQAINKTLDSERERMMQQLVANRSRDIEAYTVDDMIVAVNAYHQACSFERGLQVLLDAALDESGADAVLADRSRDAALTELRSHITQLDKALQRPALSQEEETMLQKQRADAQARMNGLIMARTDKLVGNPAAGDTLDEPKKPWEEPKE